ncbi:ABC transporter permease [Rufibacter glacialis]|uniref:ABC transporter permease n=1 Tax=Rufibacter glacialis TaxID=1259555 RepID=A0A5M8Q7H3_9BACT|nr:FtsX-like permease family protein [Rufibacter glacialis]KAA6431837.1 FtsX-like permease family protein [Rufibacter glacialis]GGK81120.1 ABC transporter permease [Rufibacter glacialis]
MFQNYFKVAYRNLIRHKGFSFINIAGLALGITACLLIGLFVVDELQYDKFLPQGERVYRVYNQVSSEEANDVITSVPPMFGTTLQESFPEAETVVRILMQQWDAQSLVEAGDQRIYEKGGLAADPGFFQVFPLPFVYGSPEKALEDPTSVVVSDKFAQKVFGNGDPVGQKVSINKQTLLVKGVFASNPKFHLPVNYVRPLAAMELPPDRMKNWGWQQFYTYVKVKEGTDPAFMLGKFRELVKKQVDPETEKPFKYEPFFQPLHQVHLYSASFKFDQAIRGNITYVKALSIIAAFLLLIACFNFVNLSTAKSLQRAKEVGIRKTIGASRKQLLLQFLSETLLLTLISVVFAAALTSLFLPWLNTFTEKEMTFNVFSQPALLLLLLALVLVVGILAGLYPALVLAGFKPVAVLKGAAVSDGGPGKTPWLRHGLIVVQFALSIFLIISALVVYRQVEFLHNKDLGFNKDQILFFPMRGENMFTNYETFKRELLKSPGVANVSIGYGFPGDATAGDAIEVLKNGEWVHHSVTQLMVDHDYINTLGLQMVAGRPFSKDRPTDKDAAFIINETAVRDMGFGTPEKALGQKMEWKVWSDKPDSLKRGEVIGVVKDFHFKSLFDKVDPTVLQIFPGANWKVAVKLKSDQVEGAMSHVKNVWDDFSPEYPMEYKFMDENFEVMYKAEDKLRSLLWIFTGLAIFVGCLGLFGLAAYAAERRKKEIGIRKILGAETSSIVTLLSKDFLKLVLIAGLLAVPLAWYAMSKWLEDFAYRIEIPVWAFLAAFALAALVAFLTVSYQALKAATLNPVKNLRMD